MGQKVHPKGLRLDIVKDWDAKWFSQKKYSQYVYEDYKIRKYIKDNLAHAGISVVNIERIANRVRITINCARPGIVIGRKGAEVNKLKDNLTKLVEGELQINIKEVKVPEIDAQLVAEDIANQILRRSAARRIMKQTAARAIRMKAEGIKIMISGRIGGAEIARTEWHMEGRLPLHTLRADIDYGFAEANTTYGKIGIKVWIFKGEVLPKSTATETIIGKNKDSAEEKSTPILTGGSKSKDELMEDKNASAD